MISQPQIKSDNHSGAGKPLPKHTALALITISILSLLVAGYSALIHVTTLTQQQFVTNTQTLGGTFTVMNVETQTVTSLTTLTDTNLPAGYYQYCNVYNCNSYAAPPGYYDLGCYPSGPYSVVGSYSVQCSGYLFIDGSGCTDLLVPIDDGYTNNIQQYYNLRNLPTSHPSIGSWVTVRGELTQQGSNMGPNGGACPASSIIISSIS